MKKIRFFLFMLICLVLQSFIFTSTPASAADLECALQPIEKYQAKDYSHLFGTLNGLSENQLRQHYTLYTGYIDRINAINEKIKEEIEETETEKDVTEDIEFRGLMVEKSFNNNGVILHELYFSNLTPRQTQPSQPFTTLINRDFGSYQNYIANLRKNAKISRGWVITAYNCRDGKIHNYIIDSHDLHVPIHIRPLLVMDVWEHAYMIDYGINRDTYIDTFFRNVDWQVVSQRLETAISTR